ncbi:MAG: hypothetical protein ACTSV7_04305, partial [Candidatus Baldrarchaeia archaeon]
MQRDHQVNILPIENVEILKITDAIKKYPWIKEHIPKPAEGYFMWIKKTVKIPLSGCFLIASPGTKQKPANLLILEENVKATLRTICAAELPDLAGSHTGFTKIVLKEKSQLNIEHVHRWGKRDTVITSLNVLLHPRARLKYDYRSLEAPKKLSIITKAELLDNASFSLTTAVDAENSNI